MLENVSCQNELPSHCRLCAIIAINSPDMSTNKIFINKDGKTSCIKLLPPLLLDETMPQTKFKRF